MVLRKPFTRILVACLALGLWFTSAVAQTRPRVAASGTKCQEVLELPAPANAPFADGHRTPDHPRRPGDQCPPATKCNIRTA